MIESRFKLCQQIFDDYFRVTDEPHDCVAVKYIRHLFDAILSHLKQYKNISIKEFYEYLETATPFRKKLKRCRPDNKLQYVFCAENVGFTHS